MQLRSLAIDQLHLLESLDFLEKADCRDLPEPREFLDCRDLQVQYQI